MNILIAVIIFSLIIIFHELGHFLVAKLNHIRVYEFTLGLGPTLFGFTKGETKYCLKALPFGGSCVMGEDDEADVTDPRAFNNKSVWARMAVVAAGPIFNFILALLLSLIVVGLAGYDLPEILSVQADSPAAEAGLQEGDVITRLNGKHINLSREVTLETMLYPEKELEIVYEREENGKTVTGTAIVTPEWKKAYQIGIYLGTGEGQEAAVTDLVAGAPAESAGIKAGDRIVKVNGKAVETSDEVSAAIRSSESKELEVVVERDGKQQTFDVTANDTSAYSSGLYLDSGYRSRESVFAVIKYSFYEVKYWINTTFKTLGLLFTGGVSVNDLSGPVGIVDTIGQSYEQSREYGWTSVLLTMLNLSILLSANLGVMNLLPIPALDGGRLLFFIIEAIRGKRMDQKKEGLVHMIGFMLLMALMLVVLINDVRKIFFM